MHKTILTYAARLAFNVRNARNAATGRSRHAEIVQKAMPLATIPNEGQEARERSACPLHEHPEYEARYLTSRRKNRIEHLETRLMSLESALRLNDPAVNPVSTNQTAESDKPVQAPPADQKNERIGDLHPRNNSFPREITQERALGAGNGQVDLETVDLTVATPNPPPATYAQQDKPTPAQIFSNFSDFTQDVRMGYQWIRAHETGGSYDNKVFARLPTYQQVLSLVEPIVESLQQHGVVITPDSFISLLDEQYSAGPDCYADNSARWAIVNSFFATALLTRSTTDFLKQIKPTAWNYFKNAFSMFPELITQGRDVSACEALVAMAMFAQRSADAQLTVQITAALTRLVQTLGLHRSRFYVSLDPIAVQRHHRVLWVAYILDVQAMETNDFGPSLAIRDLAVTFQHDASTPRSTNSENFGSHDLLRWRAELAVIQGRIYEALNPAKTNRMKNDELLKVVISMDEQLQEWKKGLPERVWIIQHDDESDLILSIAHLHCAFYNSISRVHMVLVNPRDSNLSELNQSLAAGGTQMEAETQNALATCAASARNVIQVVTNLASQPFFQLW